jgi:hypothetical protein
MREAVRFRSIIDPASVRLQREAHEERVVRGVLVVARAAGGERESEAGVEGDGGGAGGADLEDNFGCVLRMRPVEHGAAEGAADAGTAGAGGDDDTLQLGDALGCGGIRGLMDMVPARRL